MKPTHTHNYFRRPNWRQVVFALVIGFAWGLVPNVYQSWVARREYSQRYSKLLELPSSISHPRSHLERMPGVVGKALWIDFYQPNADEDGKLRAWFVKHDGFSEFKSRYPRFSNLISDWHAERGNKFLIVSRDQDNGWVHISFGQSMPPAEAAKDLDNFPWKSAQQDWQSHL